MRTRIKRDFHLLYLLRGLLLFSISLPIIMATTNVQVMPAAQPLDISIRMAHIMMKALVVKVNMVKAAKLVLALNIVKFAIPDSLLEVMAMPDSNS